MRHGILQITFIAVLLAEISSPVQAVCTVSVINRGVSLSLQQAIDGAFPGQTINLPAGTCDDNVTIQENKERITIDGGGSATINGIDTTRSTIGIRGRGIVITGLTVTGGENAIGISRGGTATITNSTLQNATRDGLSVSQGANGRITNSTVQNNARRGIHVGANASARIGFLTFEGVDTIPGGVGPVTIQNNAEDGIFIFASANAQVVNNTIENNGGNGVAVRQTAHGLVASNTINNNGGNGIDISENSGVNLGRDTGTELDELPNSTTVNNVGFGIDCSINSYANGRLGTLNGTSGPTNFPTGCVNSLMP